MRRQWWVLAAVLCLVGAAALCTRAKAPRERGELTEAEKAVVAAFTSGTISRESPIRVAFHEAVARPEQVGAPLEPSPFRFEPRIDGTSVWAAPDRVEFRPAERLPDGQTYAASLDLSPLLPTGKTPLARFDFVFSTMRQSFDVAVDGLQAEDATDVKRQALTGRLITADVEEAPGVERVLRASFAGRDLPVAWAHEPNRRVHAFTVGGIERAETATALRLSWNGGPIGVERQEAREIAVPGLDTFTVDQARVVAAPEPHVELRFTDPLKPGQDLKGLVRIADRDDLRFVTDGSRLEVYGTKGWRGEQTVRVEAGVRNVLGYRMKEARELVVQFERLKPAVRFAGKGVIVPTSAGFTIPIEAVNLRAVTVEALMIPSSNVPQFLQTNPLDGEQELQRVGRVVWKKTLSLDTTADRENRWVSVGLDVSPLLAKSPGGMYRLTLSFRRPHAVWPCEGQPAPAELERAERGPDDAIEESSWDAWEESEAGDWDQRFENRDNPCHPAYYQRFYDHDIRAARNVLVSDLGLMAKAGEDDTVIVFANDLRTTDPVSGAEVTLLDYQQQALGSARTDRDGIARVAVPRPAFLATVRHGGQAGYLRLDGGSALPMAHFDVVGTRSPRGLKGFLYGERGIWRPGDTLHLTFVLQDPTRRLAADHPVRFDLLDPRGQLVKSLTRTQSIDGFYAFEAATSPDAPTGNYTGRVSVGGATFDKTLKIETVMPNRLKIAMDFGTDELRAKGRISGLLSAAWLHGAPARSLKADVELALSPAPTSFKRFEEYSFDDPTRKYDTERQKVFEGPLDPQGQARVSAAVTAEALSPGKLRADFTTRVFEPGGAFSIDRFSIPYSPYERYVGLRTPKGDKARGMLLTDTKHRIDLALVSADGAPGGEGEVEVKLYKVDWRWWWERGEEDLAAWADANVHTPLVSAVVKMASGAGSWELEIKQPEWGRYLLLASDRSGGHRAGRILYIDWPGWAGRGQKEGGGGASVLAFAADKPEYAPGETVTLAIPTPRKGRGLVSLESGSSVLRTEWIEVKGAETRYAFTATAEMAPNIYAHVTLLQPHAQTANDLPIRLYGVAPVKVVSPQTRLQPVLGVPEVLAPEATSTITVREASGRPMAYTLAVVDEGLLGLTRYATPNPWDYFYAREALAVRTWDLYDDVVGAYGAAMERMLAIGGDEAAVSAKGRRANRFPPMVRFLGPFRLAAKSLGTHKVEIPQYVGAVRVMVVAGREGAFGAAEKSVFVRRPLMLLATLPRVLGPDESVALPVSVFALEPKVKDVAVSVSTSGPLEVVAEAKKALSFSAVGDELVDFRLKAKPGLGVATATVSATSGAERASQAIEIDVRSSTARVTDVVGGTRQAGRELDAGGGLPRPRRHEPGDARGLARAPDRPRPAARVPDGVPARLRRADRLRRLPAALPREAPRAHAGETGAGRDERQGRARAAAPFPGDRRRLRDVARRRRLLGLGDELRRPLRDRGAEGGLPASSRAARPVDRLPAPPRPGMGAGRGAGRAHPGLPALHARPRGCFGAAGHEPAARAQEPSRGREVAARRRVPARRAARGRAGARRGQRGDDRALSGARGDLRIRPARPRDGPRGGRPPRHGRAHGPSRPEPLRVAVEERLAQHPGDGLRAPRALEGRGRLEGRGEDGVLVLVERRGTDGRHLGRLDRGAPDRRGLEGEADARGPQHGHERSLPSAHPLRPAARGPRDRGRERLRPRGAVPPPRRQAGRPLPPRPGHRLQDRGEGHQPRPARRLPQRRAHAGGGLRLGDPQRSARPEPAAVLVRLLRPPGRARRPRLHLLRPQGRGVEDGGGGDERQLPGPVLPADGHGRDDVRRDPQRPGEGPVGRGGGAGPVA